MREDAEHVSKIVDTLNNEAYDKDTGMRPFQLETDGDSQRVTFFGISLWESEEDERQEADGEPLGSDILEPLEGYLRYWADNKVEEIKRMSFRK